MADKLRSVNTRFWEDTFIEDLSIENKLLFLYLLTNPQTNILGVYEVSIKRISYDTGLKNETIRKGFEGFEMVRKAYFQKNYVILPNFLKNQRLNDNMKKGVIKIFKELPNWLKVSIIGNHSKGLTNDLKGFERIRNGLVKYEIGNIEIGNIEIGNIEIKKDEILENEDLDKQFLDLNKFNPDQQTEMKDHLLSQQIWIENIAMNLKCKNVSERLEEFCNEQMLCDGLLREEREIKQHFINWLKQNKDKAAKIDETAEERKQRILDSIPNPKES